MPNGNLRERTTDCRLDKVGGGDDHLRDEEQPGTVLPPSSVETMLETD